MQIDEYTGRRAACLGSGDYGAARLVGEEYLAEHPGDAMAHHQQAWTLCAMGLYPEALHHQERAAALAPARPDFSLALERLRAAIEGTKPPSSHEHFEALQRAAQASAVETITHALGSLGAWKHGRSGQDFSYRWVIEDYPMDTLAGWISFVPALCATGDIADIPRIGRYRIEDVRHVVHKRLSRGMPWEAPILALLLELASRTEGVVVDIGANVGTHVVPVSRVATVYAYEPEPQNFAALKFNLGLNDSTAIAVQKACSDRTGAGAMRDVDVLNPGLAKLGPGEDVVVTTLDAENLPPIAVIKMDVEGHEPQVVAGARQTLLRDRPIIIAEILGPSGLKTDLEALGYQAVQVFRSDWMFYPT